MTVSGESGQRGKRDCERNAKPTTKLTTKPSDNLSAKQNTKESATLSATLSAKGNAKLSAMQTSDEQQSCRAQGPPRDVAFARDKIVLLHTVVVTSALLRFRVSFFVIAEGNPFSLTPPCSFDCTKIFGRCKYPSLSPSDSTSKFANPKQHATTSKRLIVSVVLACFATQYPRR